MSERTRSLIPVKTLHETDESKVDLLAILCGTGASRNFSTVRSSVFVEQLNAFLRHRQQSPPRSLPQFAVKGCPQSVLEARCWKPSWCTTFGFWIAASILCGTSTSRRCSVVRCRKEFRLEDGIRSRGPVSNTIKPSANLEGEISTIWSTACCWKLSWCTIFAIWTSWNVAGLLGGSPQSAILSSVSQRNAVGKVATIVQLIVGDSGVDRGGVCTSCPPDRWS